MVLAFVFPFRSDESHKTVSAIPLNPTSDRSELELVLSRKTCERNTVFEKWSDHLKLSQRFSSLSVCELCELCVTARSSILLSQMLIAQFNAYRHSYSVAPLASRAARRRAGYKAAWYPENYVRA